MHVGSEQEELLTVFSGGRSCALIEWVWVAGGVEGGGLRRWGLGGLRGGAGWVVLGGREGGEGEGMGGTTCRESQRCTVRRHLKGPRLLRFNKTLRSHCVGSNLKHGEQMNCLMTGSNEPVKKTFPCYIPLQHAICLFLKGKLLAEPTQKKILT